MYYYEVLVADNSFKGSGALTYASDTELARGHVVEVPVKQRKVLGIVARPVPRPKFPTRPLATTVATQPLPEPLITLAEWMPTYYPASTGETLQQFLPSKLYEYEPAPVEEPPRGLSEPPDSGISDQLPVDHRDDQPLTGWRVPQQGEATGAGGLPPLTDEQQQVVASIQNPDTYLLHGETGSGKTRVYIELAQRTLRASRSSIVLTPEIGLTPQLTHSFEQVFGADSVVTTHSKLTAKERNLQWVRVLAARQPLVVLGPRSALFMPLRDVGLIILDESHEASYKQEQAPHYHASKVAARLAYLHQAMLVLGSATPPVTDYYVAQAKGKTILRMRHIASGAKDGNAGVETTIVDLKDRAQFTRKPHLSDILLRSVEQSLRAGEQSLVFLNRRGTARTVLCEQCGWIATCGHCDLPLTYHGDVHNLRCHTCGLVAPAFTSCPECDSPRILMKSVGTKAIVDELQSAFPQATIQRFDTDNKKSERLEAHYHDVRAGKVDIVVGTQIIAKGLDLPRLSTVGVITADTSLYLPDYTAQERTYQLLRQVIGRVGRGHRAGGTDRSAERVILQTYDPASPVIQAAAKGSETSWDDFYAAELAERQAFLFPPFVHTLKLSCRRASATAAEAAADKVAEALRASGLRLIVDGPMPALHEKHGDKYQWQLVCKAKDRGQLIQAIGLLPANWSYDIDPNNLL